MKKISFFLYAFALTGALFTISCNKDDDDEGSGPSYKKVSALVYKNYEGNGSDDSTVFTYDSKGFLTKVEEYEVTGSLKTLEYSYEFQYVKDTVVSVISYEWNGTTKIADDKDSIGYSKNRIEKFFEFDLINGKFVKEEDDITTVSYGANNLPSRYTYTPTEYLEVEYIGNNVSKTKDYEGGILRRTDTFVYDSKKNPFKGNPFYMGEFSFHNENNCTSEIDDYSTETNAYEYNSEGYPTKVTTTYTYTDSKKSGLIHSQLSKLSKMRTKMGSMESSTDVMKIYYK